MSKANIIRKMKEDHLLRYGVSPAVITIAPGRVNIIGEHTDYNNGLAMPAAIDRYIFVSLSFNSKNQINAHSDKLNKELSSPLDASGGSDIWHQYILGAVKEIFINHNIKSGVDILIYSNLPMGKGVSSSAALEVATVNGILKLFKIEESSENIIKICQKIDHNHIGIKSGTLDQSASQLSKDGAVLKINFDKGSFKYIYSKFSNCSWILVDSMIKRELASSKYHERVEECRRALSTLSQKLNRDISFRDISNNEVSLLAKSHPILSDRIKHLLEENERVNQMEKSIVNNDLKQIGELLIQSHRSLRDLYEVSCEEIDYLISVSSKFKYWYGGRIMGGGFGGSSINLIQSGHQDAYSHFIKEKYKQKFNIDSDIYNIKFSNGVEIIDNISAD